MRPLALSIVQDIFKNLAPYLETRAELDEFTLNRYKREVERNLGGDPILGNQVRAILALMEWDEAGFDEWFARALGLSDSGDVHFGYANSLQLLGRFPEAFAHAFIASERVPENLTYLSTAITYAHHSGLFDKAAELVDIYNTRSPKSLHQDTNLVKDTLQSMKILGLPDDLPARCNAVAFKLLREHKIPYSHTLMLVDVEEYAILYHICINRPADVVQKVDDELGVRLFDELPDVDPGKYWVGFDKVEA